MFESILKESLKEIDKTILSHKGVLSTMRRRHKFEKWFQMELLKHLLERIKDSKIETISEYEISGKTSKHTKTIDIVLKNDSVEFIGLELKVIPTNYSVPNFKESTKAITDSINGFINDIDKSKMFKNSYSLAFIFPFPIDTNNRNYEDFKKQTNRMEEKCNVSFWSGPETADFKSFYYLLHKKNVNE